MLQHPVTGVWHPNTSARVDLQDVLDFTVRNLNQLVQILAIGFDGLGDVVGPNGAITGNVACYADATGKLIEDGLKACAELVCQPDPVGDNTLPRMDGITGQLMQPSGVTISDLDLVAGADGYGMSLNATSPFSGGQYGLWIDNQFSTALIGYSSAGTHWSVPFVSLSGISDGDQIAWNDVAKSWQLVSGGGGGAVVPAGVNDFDYLRWDLGGAAWVAQRKPEFWFVEAIGNNGLVTNWPKHARIDNGYVTTLQDVGVLFVSQSGSSHIQGGGVLVCGSNFWGGMGGLSGRTHRWAGGTMFGQLAIQVRSNNGVLYDLLTFVNDLGQFAWFDTHVVGIRNSYTGTQKPGALDSGYGWFWLRNGCELFLRCTDGSDVLLTSGAVPGETVTDITSDGGTVIESTSNETNIPVPASGNAAITITTPFIPGSLLELVLVCKANVSTGAGVPLTNIAVGDGTDPNRFGDLSTFTINSRVDRQDWTVPTDRSGGIFFTVAEAGSINVVLTPTGDWDGGGPLCLIVFQQNSTVITF
jgi:hypothetical protein